MSKLLHSHGDTPSMAAFLVGRLVVGGFYLYAGIDNLLHLGEKVGYTAYKGAPFPLLAVIIASILLIVGGASILTGWRAAIGVAAVILFLAPVTLLLHNFWVITEPQMQMIEMHAFLSNVALMGSALLLLGVPQPWAWSVDSSAALAKRRAADAMGVQSA